MSRLSYSSRRVMSRRLITSAVKDVHEKQNKGFQWQILRRTIFLKNLVCKQMYCSFYYFVCFCEKCITRIPILKVVYITSSVMHVVFFDWETLFRVGPGVLFGRFRDRFPVVSLDFSVTYSFRPYHGPGVDSAPSENEYQEHFMR